MKKVEKFLKNEFKKMTKKFSILARKREIHFCIYVLWTAYRNKKRPLLCLHTFTFTMTGGGVGEAERASCIGVWVLDIRLEVN